jgi:enoyl-CoA hydratase
LRRPDLITIAAVAGRATGAGLFLSLACDLRIAVDDASFAIGDNAPAGVGFATAIGAQGAARLADALGYPQALELVLTGRRLSGRQAAAHGLVNLAVPADALDSALADLVAAVLSTPRAAATQALALLASSGEDRRHRSEHVAAGIRLASGEA